MMRPAFSSTRQAAAFVLLLLGLLLLPVLAGQRFLPARGEIYKYQGYGIAPLPWLHHVIFEETNVVDIAFVGSSRMFYDINAPYVQEQLSRRLGRPAVVRSICWGGAGYDLLDLVGQDLLAHRQIKMLVFYDEDGAQFRNPLVPLFFRWPEDQGKLAGLPRPEKAVFYFAALCGLPRHLLAGLRPEMASEICPSAPINLERIFNTPNPARRLGSASARRAFDPSFKFDQEQANYPPFIPCQPEVGKKQLQVYSESTKDQWRFENRNLPVWQPHFARQFVGLARQKGCQVVMLHLPSLEEARSAVVPEREFWPGDLGTNVILAGIPGAVMTAGLTEDQIRLLYFDPRHFNQNGQDFFTAMLTPTLLHLYETASPR